MTKIEELSLLTPGPAKDELAVVVNDAEAVYPVRIDPTFSDANWVSMGGVPGVDGIVYAAVIELAAGTTKATSDPAGSVANQVAAGISSLPRERQAAGSTNDPATVVTVTVGAEPVRPWASTNLVARMTITGVSMVNPPGPRGGRGCRCPRGQSGRSDQHSVQVAPPSRPAQFSSGGQVD